MGTVLKVQGLLSGGNCTGAATVLQEPPLASSHHARCPPTDGSRSREVSLLLQLRSIYIGVLELLELKTRDPHNRKSCGIEGIGAAGRSLGTTDAICPSPGMGQQSEPAFAPSLSPSSPLMSPQLPPSQSPMLQPAPPTPGYQSPDMKTWQQGAMGNSK